VAAFPDVKSFLPAPLLNWGVRRGALTKCGVRPICEVAMSREEFIEADRRVHRYLCLILLLTACTAIALGFALPAWAEAREWLRAARGEGAVRLLVGLLVEAVVLGPLILIPWLSVVWLDRRFGVRCPRCNRSVTLRGRYREILRSGRCCWCQRTLLEPADADLAEPGARPSD
jgi:hypothetical protein